MKISIIIPVLNEERNIKHCLQSLKDPGNEIEVIVVDGGSTDSTIDIIQDQGYRVIFARPGRGVQCNVGANQAQGDILIFLHGDSYFPPEGREQIQAAFSDPDVQCATFQMKFDHPHWLMRLYGYFTRIDSVFTRFGDQGIVVRAEFFHSLGGFPDWVLFEDVHFLRLARRRVKIHSLKGPVLTSARRFQAQGLIKQQIFNAVLIIQYLLGVPVEKLARRYNVKDGKI